MERRSQFFSHVPLGTSLVSFTSVTADDIVSAISRLPDPLPVSVMKLVADEIAPFLSDLFSRSMSTGHFPSTFKEAFITPAIKKPGLDVTNAQLYRPISNLSVVSKLLERIVAQQLNTYQQYYTVFCRLSSLAFGRAI